MLPNAPGGTPCIFWHVSDQYATPVRRFASHTPICDASSAKRMRSSASITARSAFSRSVMSSATPTYSTTMPSARAI
ncbi:MAG: hypothetical protein DMF93_24280, partial [Acidobacteria bacterium]